MHPNWEKVDPVGGKLSKEQALVPLVEVLAELRERYGKDPDPVRTLLILGMGVDPNVDPSAGHEGFVPTTVQLEALKAVAQYVRPKLQNVELTGKDQGPVRIEAELAAKIGGDPELLELAERFAIQMTKKSIEDTELDRKES